MNKLLNKSIFIGMIVWNTYFWVIFVLGMFALLEFEFISNQQELAFQKHPIIMNLFSFNLNTLNPVIPLTNVLTRTFGNTGLIIMITFQLLIGVLFGISIFYVKKLITALKQKI